MRGTPLVLRPVHRSVAWPIGYVSLLAAALAGCAGARHGAAKPAAGAATIAPERPRTDWLDDGATAIWAGHLGEAQRALLEVADREVRRPDSALDFWSELVALLRCEPLRALPHASRPLVSPWDQLRRLVQLERLRFALVAGTPAPGQGDKHAPGGTPPATRSTFSVSPPPADALSWPIEAERWSDEAPAARAVSDRCPEQGVGRDDHRWTPADAAKLMMVRELTAALPADHPALPALLFEQAVLAIASGDSKGAHAPLLRLPHEGVGPTSPFSDGERAQLVFTWAIAADADADAEPSHREAAQLRLRAAIATDLPHDVRRVLSFRLSEQLRAAGRIDDAVAAIGAPPHGDDALGRYLAFRQMEAHFKAGRRAEALAEAREALGRHRRATVDGHTALAAIDDFAMHLLVGSPVSDESIEVLEALGDPSERLARVDRFAQMAGALGAQASAMAAFLWLMQNDRDENRRLHHLARASVAAARAGDRVQFSRTFALLAGEGDDLDPAAKPGKVPPSSPIAKDKRAKPAGGLIDSPDADRLYQSRRRERSLSWQRAMLVVARDALPALVDSDDQANLKILVDRLQQHLTAHGRGPVDAELTTVYRAASAHLRTGARAYAERVGSAHRPILLGDIAVERRYDVVAPVIPLFPKGPGSLLWVPAAGHDPSASHLRRWTSPLGASLTIAEVKR